MHLSLLLKPHTLFLLDDLIGFLPEVNQDLVFLLDLFFVVHNLLSYVVLECHEMVRVSYEALVDLATFARATDWKILAEISGVDIHLVVLVQFLSQCPYSAERDIRLLV